MKTKEQILAWLDKQPWKDEFYKAIFLYGNPKRVYNVNFLISAFHWGETIQRETIWSKRNKEYQKWYNSTSTDKPHSWEEYCIQNPITKDDWCIEYGEVCDVFDQRFYTTEQERDPMTCIDVMPKEHCEAFVAYMKLFQLRNAWVKNENLEELPTTYKILYQDGGFDVFRGHTSTGLSFVSKEDAKEFAETFRELLNIAKPLL